MQKLIETDRQELYKFGKTILMGGPVLGTLALGLWYWKGIGHALHASYVLYSLASYALLTTFIRPILLFPVYVLMTAIGNTVQWIMSTIVLGFVFLFMMTPVALFFRLTGRDRLKLRHEPTASSYWEAKPPPKGSIERYEKQF